MTPRRRVGVQRQVAASSASTSATAATGVSSRSARSGDLDRGDTRLLYLMARAISPLVVALLLAVSGAVNPALTPVPTHVPTPQCDDGHEWDGASCSQCGR